MKINLEIEVPIEDPDEYDRELIADYLSDLAEYVPEDLLLTLGRVEA